MPFSKATYYQQVTAFVCVCCTGREHAIALLGITVSILPLNPANAGQCFRYTLVNQWNIFHDFDLKPLYDFYFYLNNYKRFFLQNNLNIRAEI